MKAPRKHSTKVVFMRFRDGEYWEEWNLRFNCGSKQNNPVKFFAERVWRSDLSIALCPFAATRGDFPDERNASAHFAEQAMACGGEVVELSALLVKQLSDRFGYAPRKI
jgi:hypothetical protein